MKDRASAYPGRVKLTPVSGQTNVYDLERWDSPTEPGTALNKANLLNDAVAEFLGLDNTAVPNDAFQQLGRKQKAILKYTDINTSGTWTVPNDLLYGKIFVMVVGGGGSGGTSSTSSRTGAGGGSGHISYGTLDVTPGQSITAVIGAGGAARSSGGQKGANGGTTTFGTLSAAGGEGGGAYSTSGFYGGYGGAGGGGGLYGLGGNGSFGGGGGSVAGKGGNGGPFGGGGYSAGSNIATGGTYGGNGGNSSTNSIAGAQYEGSFEMWELAADYYGVEKVAHIQPNTITVSKVGGGGLGFTLNSLIGAGSSYYETGGCGMFAYPGLSSNSSNGAGGGLFYSPKMQTSGKFYWGGAGFYSASNSQLRGAGGAPSSQTASYAGGNGVIGIWYYTLPTNYLNVNI